MRQVVESFRIDFPNVVVLQVPESRQTKKKDDDLDYTLGEAIHTVAELSTRDYNVAN